MAGALVRELTVPSPSISGTGAVRGYSLASEPGGAKGDIQHSTHGGLVRAQAVDEVNEG